MYNSFELVGLVVGIAGIVVTCINLKLSARLITVAAGFGLVALANASRALWSFSYYVPYPLRDFLRSSESLPLLFVGLALIVVGLFRFFAQLNAATQGQPVDSLAQRDDYYDDEPSSRGPQKRY